MPHAGATGVADSTNKQKHSSSSGASMPHPSGAGALALAHGSASSISNASLAYNSILEPLFIPQVTNLVNVMEAPNSATGEEIINLQQLKKVKLRE